MPVALRDIAKDCGVSPATVSLAMSGDPRVAAATRSRVLESASRLGYAPSAIAQMLRSGATNTVVLAYVKSGDLALAAAGALPIMAEGLGMHGYRLAVRSADSNDDLLLMLEDMVRTRGADAFVLWGYEADVESQGEMLQSLGQPFVARGYHETRHPDWPQVDYDHYGMVRQTIDKLIELGHRRIGFVSHGNDQVYAVNLLSAFRTLHRERFGAPASEEWILLHEETIESAKAAREKLLSWFEGPDENRPTALAVGEIGSISALVDLCLLSEGLRVGNGPDEFAIAGITNYPRSRIITGPTWHYTSAEEAAMVGQMLDRQLVPLLRGRQPEVLSLRYLPELRRGATEFDIWSRGKLRSTRRS